MRYGQNIESVFSNSPVLNPDGSQGISVHIDRGQGLTDGSPFTGGGNQLDYHFTMDFNQTAASTSTPGATDYVCFYDYKNHYFDPDRLNIFHYCVFGFTTPDFFSGKAEIWGNDFMITLSEEYYYRYTEIGQVGSFVHELGHNIGLRHGGIDNGALDADTNYKPNLPSTMNYRYQFQGISIDCDFTSENIHSFSRGMLNPIFEPSVDEKIGICDNLPLDLNGGGISRTVGPKDVDQNGNKIDDLYDYDQWGNLKLNFWYPGSRWCNN